ncbi:MAG: L-threonylcarbamoyladenylate synthase [Nitrospirales bacterium]
MAKILQVPVNPCPSLLEEIIHCVAHGGVLAVATESFYALAGSATHSEAVSRVARIKGGPNPKPILVLIGDRRQLTHLVSSLPPHADLLFDHFWPGPLTVVLSALPDLSPDLTAGTGTVGIRQPGNSKLLWLLQGVGPLTGTSANRSGAPPPRTAQEVQKTLGDEVDLIIDDGPTPGGKPSTVLNLFREIRILREGPISKEEIRTALASKGFTLED